MQSHFATLTGPVVGNQRGMRRWPDGSMQKNKTYVFPRKIAQIGRSFYGLMGISTE